MKNRIKFFDKLFCTILYICLFLTPLLVMPGGLSIFEVPKITFFRSVVMILLSITVIRFFTVGLKIPKVINQNCRKFLYLVAIFVTLMVLPFIFSVAPKLSFFGSYTRIQGLYSLTHYFIFFFLLLLNFSERKKWELAFKVIFLSTFLVLIYGFVQITIGDFLGYNIEETSLGRMFSTFGQPNYLGYYLLLVFFPALSFLLKEKSGKNRLFYLLIVILILVGIYLAGSRAVYISLVVALIYYLVRKFFGKWSKIFVTLFIFSLISFGLLIVLFGSQINYFSEDTSLRSLNSRVIIWNSALEAIQERPLLGYGFETFSLINPKYLDADIYRYERLEIIPERTHHLFLQLLVDGGIIYLLTFLTVFLSIFSYSLKSKIKNAEELIISETLTIGALFSLFFGFFVTAHFTLASFLLAYWVFLLNKGHEEIVPKFSTQRKFFVILVIIFAAMNIVFLNFSFLLSDYSVKKGLGEIFSGNINLGVADVEIANSLYPYQDFYRFIISDLYLQLNDFEKSLIHMNEASKFKNGLDTNTELKLAEIFGQNCLNDEGKCTIAKYYFSKSIELAPNYSKNYLSAGKFYFENNDCINSLKYFDYYSELVNLRKPFISAEKTGIFLKHNPGYSEYLDMISKCRFN